MADVLDPLVLDLVEWVAARPRQYREVIDTWRTSCPRLTVWEEAVDRGLVRRQSVADGGTFVVATPLGERMLASHGRASPSPR